MSRIGNIPIPLPPKVEVTLADGEITVKGPLGALTRTFGDSVTIEKDGDTLVCKAANEEASAMHGTLRALVANMVKGVTEGFEKKLTLVGVGYRAQAAGDKINLSLGFSHPVVHTMPKGVKVETPVQTEILVKGIDKQQVGQVAAEIRAYRPPEPYKGKGVRYADERVVDQRNEEEVSAADDRGHAMNKREARVRRARKTRVRIAAAARDAARGEPVELPHLRADHRADGRPGARERVDARGRRAQGRRRTAATRRPRRSSASASPNARRRSASRRSRSTARASGITAACRRWPTRPAKPASSSSGRRSDKVRHGTNAATAAAAGRARRRPAREDDRDQPRHQGGEGRTRFWASPR